MEDSMEPDPLPQTSGKVRNHRRRALIGAAIGFGLIGFLQWIAPATDHQYANMGSLLAGIVTTIYVAFQIHQWAVQCGHRLILPAAILLVLGSLATIFRFDGFSGEMLPEFKLRFAAAPLELRSVNESTSAGAIEAARPVAETNSDSLGFLGTDRTGVIPERQFAIPTKASQGETLWNQGIGQGWSSFAVSGDRAVTLEQREELECVTCYRLADGELLWIQDHKARHENALGGIGPRSTPTIVDDRVYAQGATGRVWCLDLNSGEVHWTVDLLELAGWDTLASEVAIAWGRAGSPLIVDGMCVVPYGGPEANKLTGRSLIALDAETGETRWTAGEDQISFASPVLMSLAGKRQIVSVNEKTITGHEVEEGKVLWEFDWFGQSNGSANCASVVPVGNDQFLIGKGYGGGSALVEIGKDANGSLTAKSVWTSTQLLKTKFTHACVDGDIAYAISNGSLEAVTISEARRQWTQPRHSRFGQGQIVLLDDTIVAQSESGEVAFVAADPADYRELLRIPALDSKTWNVPTVAGRYLLVRNDRQAICFLLPARED